MWGEFFSWEEGAAVLFGAMSGTGGGEEVEAGGQMSKLEKAGRAAYVEGYLHGLWTEPRTTEDEDSEDAEEAWEGSVTRAAILAIAAGR